MVLEVKVLLFLFVFLGDHNSPISLERLNMQFPPSAISADVEELIIGINYLNPS
jgi:hypothetical protein